MANPEYTQAGEELVVDLIDGTAAVPTYHIGWGTGTTPPVKGNTALETPAPEARVSSVQSQPAADKNRFVATITATGSRAITEAGLFSALAAGTLVIRGTFAAINVVTNDKIEFTFELEQT